LRFAVQAGHAPAGAMAGHISGAYAAHLRRRRGWAGSIFKHYVAIPVDGDLFLDDLVIWLHRRPEPNEPQSARANFCWTADSAYLTAKSSTWITTERVLAALSPGGAGRSAYCRRKTQPPAPEIIAIVTGRSAHRPKQRVGDVNATTPSMGQTRPERPTIEDIVHFVADYSQIAYDDMRSSSRRRAISKAKVVATVLCTRNGASVAAVARLFGCSRSTLIEMAERYRQREPQLFADADRVLEAYVEKARGLRDHQRVRQPQAARLSQRHFDRRCA
jgi:transposase-like protein